METTAMLTTEAAASGKAIALKLTTADVVDTSRE
jgi:hypothetical protein